MRELEWPEWAKSANIYEVNIRQYTTEGTFAAFEKHLPRLKEMEVDILWFMPIFPISITNRKGTLGSYYAPSTYREVNPEFGTMEDFKNVVSRAHKLGMHVIIDWVPNHTGWDHPWVTDHPGFYLTDKTGKISEPVDWAGEPTGWTDVAQLDYRNPQMRQEMIKDMLFWINEVGLDGFRQDMALLVPLDFWSEVAAILTYAKKDIFLVAESEHFDHVNRGCFHTFYGWSWHHILNQIAQQKEVPAAIDHWFHHTRTNVSKGTYMIFTSNHDENSWSGSEIERMGLAYKAMAVLNYTLDALPLLYSGQEEPLTHRLDFFEKDNIGFNQFHNQGFYTALNRLRHKNKALWHMHFGGQIQRFLQANHDIFAFLREKDGDIVYSMINLSNKRQVLIMDRDIVGFDIFSGQAIKLLKGESLTLRPWGYQVVSSVKL